MLGFYPALVVSIVVSLVASPVFCEPEQKTYSAIIQFSNPLDAKETVNAAFHTLFAIRTVLNQLNALALTSINSGQFGNNKKFQSLKGSISRILFDQKTSFHLFGENVVLIEIVNDGHNNHYQYTIPAMSFDELGLDEDNLLTANDIDTAHIHLEKAKETLLTILMPNTTNPLSTLEPLNVYTIKETDGVKSIIASLGKAYHALAIKLALLQQLVDLAQNESEKLESLNAQFQEIKQALKNTFEHSVFHYRRGFNDNELTFSLTNDHYYYYFPKLTLGEFQLDTDLIVDYDSSLKSYEDINRMLLWVDNWENLHRPVIKDKSVTNSSITIL